MKQQVKMNQNSGYSPIILMLMVNHGQYDLGREIRTPY